MCRSIRRKVSVDAIDGAIDELFPIEPVAVAKLDGGGRGMGDAGLAGPGARERRDGNQDCKANAEVG